MSNGSPISTPSGGGALSGMGEKFSPDLFTGTGNFSVPISIPPGRNGFQPSVSLNYSSGGGNSAFGLGWGISIPGIMRKTAKGVPLYDNLKDTFILSGAEDLIQVEEGDGWRRYQPRTEGMFARIYHYYTEGNDYWKVMTKDGLVSYYGTPASKGSDDAAVADPDNSNNIFAWKLTQTVDPFGNVILYRYFRDEGEDDYHHWNQLYLKEMVYADYRIDNDPETYHFSKVVFEYEDRPDPYSSYKQGFEERTRLRCTSIDLYHQPWNDVAEVQQVIHTKRYSLQYLDTVAGSNELLPLNEVSLLASISIEGYDGELTESMPPLEFRYSQFNPKHQKFQKVKGKDLPLTTIGSGNFELVDLFGNGLPDIVEVNGLVRYWKNLGNNTFDSPRLMKDAPAGINLQDTNVQFIDANGDGRTDVMVNKPDISGYFSTRFGAGWDKNAFKKYKYAPSFSLADPNVRMLDLDGDGVTDAMRSGASLECFFNDEDDGWVSTKTIPRRQLAGLESINFNDPHVKFADLSGDGMQDMVLVKSGNITYWPNMGRGRFGKPVRMKNSPRLPYGYDPARIIVGDVDGDGAADLIYVDYDKVTFWINQTGNAWSEQIEITGTPAVTNVKGIRLVDLNGTGISGLLYSFDAQRASAPRYYFLDLTAGIKPYLLHEVDNNMGSLTRTHYKPSTYYYLRDQKKPETRWKTTLPFPVQVVAQVEVIDQISKGKLTTQFLYHHGYWDGGEREFRGFGRVDQRDTETFESYNNTTLFGNLSNSAHDGVYTPEENTDPDTFTQTDIEYYTPPVETRNWFNMGPVGDEFGEWYELDLSHEFWQEDPNILERDSNTVSLLKSLPRRAKRDALRTLRGSSIRTELYALDEQVNGEYVPGAGARPYTVTESQTGLKLFFDPNNPQFDGSITTDQVRKNKGIGSGYIFFSFGFANRTSQWERGNDPMTQLSFTGDFDEYGQSQKQLSIAVPRTRQFNYMETDTGATEKFLVTSGSNSFIYRDETFELDGQDHYMVNRSKEGKGFEVVNSGRESVPQIVNFFLGNLYNDVTAATTLSTALLSHSINYYDGPAFGHLAYGELGDYGLSTKTETLIFTDTMLSEIFDGNIPIFFQNPTGTITDADLLTAGCPQGFIDSLQNGDKRLGYIYGTESYHETGGWYVPSGKQKYDFHDNPVTGRGLLLELRDIFEAYSTIEYDIHQLIPVKSTQFITAYGVVPAISLETSAIYDYRLLQASEITDPNGNRIAYAFSPLGLMQKNAVMGKTTENKGDTLDHPSVWMEYDLSAWKDQQQPIWVRTCQRINHWQDNINDDYIEAVEYSDGFGRLLQTRTLAEDIIYGDPTFGGSNLPADPSAANQPTVGIERTAGSPYNVRVSGWVRYDNKGQAVEQYEPFFSTGFSYQPVEESQKGQKSKVHYNPTGAMVRTQNPDGSEHRAFFGKPDNLTIVPDHQTTEGITSTAWETYTYDENDLSGITHPSTSGSYSSHRWTPNSYTLDALGRTVTTTSRTENNETITLSYQNDIQGNLLSITDAFGRIVFRNQYDLMNQKIKVEHIDGGIKLNINDATGKPIIAYDNGKGSCSYSSYDSVARPLKVYGKDNSNEPLTLRNYVLYGEDTSAGLTNPKSTNHLGKPYKNYTEAGLVTISEYDFKGNVLGKTQQVIKDSLVLDAINDGVNTNWQINPYRTDWTGTPWNEEVNLLEGDYQTDSKYDALNRVIEVKLPADVNNVRKTITPTFNRAGVAEKISYDGVDYVQLMAHDAKGHVSIATFYNEMMARYAYDPETFRLKRVRAERFTYSQNNNEHTYTTASNVRQDMTYEYDLVGNILRQTNYVSDSGVINTLDGADKLVKLFKYDPLYRLLEATGREANTNPGSSPWSEPTTIATTSNSSNTRLYKERYEYDKMGRITKLVHTADSNNYSRLYKYTSGGNTLETITDNAGIPNILASFTNDSNGNRTGANTERHMEYDAADMMRCYYNQTGSGEPSVYAQYLYSYGKRQKKFVRTGSDEYQVTVYIDGVFEYHKLVSGTTTEKKNYVQVQGGIEIRTEGFTEDIGIPEVIYSITDHLSSVTTRIDNNRNYVDKEEFTPYGETCLRTIGSKRYRYTGKEKDSESGLYYLGARYYAPWTCSFLTVDPASTETHYQSPYNYADCNPIVMNDPTGMQSNGSKNSSSSSVIAAKRNPVQHSDGTFSQTFFQVTKTVTKNEDNSESVTYEIHNLTYNYTINDKGEREYFGPIGRKNATGGSQTDAAEKYLMGESRNISLPDYNGTGFLKQASDFIDSIDGPNDPTLTSVATTNDSYQRSNYKEQIQKNSAQFQKEAAGKGSVEKSNIAKKAVEARTQTRTEFQNKLSPSGKATSKIVDKSPSFQELKAKYKAEGYTGKGGGKGSVYDKIIAKSGESNKWMSRLGKAGKVLGPAMMIYGIATDINTFAKDPTWETAGKIAFDNVASYGLYTAGAIIGTAIGGPILGAVLGGLFSYYGMKALYSTPGPQYNVPESEPIDINNFQYYYAEPDATRVAQPAYILPR